MRNIVESWIEFYEVDRSVRKGFFDTLFMDNPTEYEIEEIYKPFINKNELTERMSRYLKDYRNGGIKDETENKKEYLEELLKADIEEKKLVVENEKLFENINFPTKFQFNSNNEEVNKKVMSDVFSQRFGDFFGRKKIDQNPKTFAIFQAIDCISSHYSFAQYLSKPLVDLNYSGDHIYEFLMRGGVYAVIDDTVYYSFKE
ncbi:hypothetical protein [uncultured Tenacibaculum sp.]|uniref:hypothetical protein n=1 Tax=uncultured Tenacibaculum sp. TaxID=174713 RepID=UPI00260E2517|nr:hypothetical protein [uncultured Tenacibaculum sp.]